MDFLHFRIVDTVSILHDGARARQREMLVGVARSINYERGPSSQFRSSAASNGTRTILPSMLSCKSKRLLVNLGQQASFFVSAGRPGFVSNCAHRTSTVLSCAFCEHGRRARLPCHSPRKEKAGQVLQPDRPFITRQRPTFPLPHSSSIIGLGGLNFRVRYGNGCGPSGNATGNFLRVLSLKF